MGALILDEEYRPEFDGLDRDGSAGAVRTVMSHCPKSFGDRSTELLDLLLQLQGVHDLARIESWPANLAEVATEFDLTPRPWGETV